MSEFDRDDLNRVRRLAKRATYDRETVYGIFDAAPICHVAFVQDEQPVVIPTIHGRIGDQVFLHGAVASRLLKHVAAGHPLSITATLVDGLVLARSLFHHSMNYRSVVLFGRGRAVTEDADKLRALEAITERLIPGRWNDA